MTKPLAYYNRKLITDVKSFIVQAAGACNIKLYMVVFNSVL